MNVNIRLMGCLLAMSTAHGYPSYLGCDKVRVFISILLKWGGFTVCLAGHDSIKHNYALHSADIKRRGSHQIRECRVWRDGIDRYFADSIIFSEVYFPVDNLS
jgi:hypothetical protein